MDNNLRLIELAAASLGLSYEKVIKDGDLWNPIDNDSDAFRLLVELEFTIEIYEDGDIGVVKVSSSSFCCYDGFDNIRECFSVSRKDKFEKVRLAITKAAAQVGSQER